MFVKLLSFEIIYLSFYNRKVDYNMVFLNSMESILTIVIIIAIGYYLTDKKWFNEDTSKLFTKLVTNISLPAYMLYNITDSFDKKKLIHLATGLWVPFLSIFLCFIIALLFSKLFRIDKDKQGTFQSMFFNSNSIFIGLPVNMALFGNDSLPYVLLYYMANTTFFWTLGVYCISKDSKDRDNKNLSKGLIKRIISPPLMGFLVAIILIIFDINLPKFVLDTCKYLGNLTTPLSMLFIGICIHNVKIKSLKFDRSISGVLLGRYLISPFLMMAIVWLVPLPLLMKQVFIIQSAMPVMTNAPIVAKAYGADSEYPAIMVTISTILAMLTIPLYMILVQQL